MNLFKRVRLLEELQFSNLNESIGLTMSSRPISKLQVAS